jgi:hypothetical protein
VQWASIVVGFQSGRRDSNILVNNYTYHSFFVNMQATF